METSQLISPFLNKINDYIFDWHRFPIDYWWRNKYKVAFGSKVHREMSFIDMLIEFQEDKLINKLISTSVEENDESDLESEGQMTQQEVDEDFANLDLTQIY